jgi:hemoglobin-like flavoprotein
MGEVETFVASLKRCLADSGFLPAFYRLFMESSEEVRRKFAATDFERQNRMVAESLWVMATAAQGLPGSPARTGLPEIAERHSRRGLDIRPELYDGWLSCLVAAARLHDPAFSPETETAWRRTLAVGIESMRSRY